MIVSSRSAQDVTYLSSTYLYYIHEEPLNLGAINLIIKYIPTYVKAIIFLKGESSMVIIVFIHFLITFTDTHIMALAVIYKMTKPDAAMCKEFSGI